MNKLMESMLERALRKHGAEKAAKAEETRFDFKGVKDVDEETVRAYMNTTNEKTRRLPLLVAGQVYADIEDAFTRPGRLDALQMAQMRGGMMALRRFATLWLEGQKR